MIQKEATACPRTASGLSICNPPAQACAWQADQAGHADRLAAAYQASQLRRDNEDALTGGIPALGRGARASVATLRELQVRHDTVTPFWHQYLVLVKVGSVFAVCLTVCRRPSRAWIRLHTHDEAERTEGPARLSTSGLAAAGSHGQRMTAALPALICCCKVHRAYLHTCRSAHNGQP